MASYPSSLFSAAAKASQTPSSPWLTNTWAGLCPVKPRIQASRPSRSAWPETPGRTVISARTAIVSPKSLTSFAPSLSRRPSVPSAW